LRLLLLHVLQVVPDLGAGAGRCRRS
jgi:hypothetical protein